MDGEDEGHSVFIYVEGPAEGYVDREHLSSSYNEQRVLLSLHDIVLIRVVQRSILCKQQVHLLHGNHHVRPLNRCNMGKSIPIYHADLRTFLTNAKTKTKTDDDDDNQHCQ